ncbi:hypothetical protein APHAL10511_008304 [Amanita phalloides]|nr:hypothetical protein APHAL10511_008304 [Amanita phalloides]
MIFEMSPLTSNFPSSQVAISPPSPRNSYDKEPFLYHFPVLKNCNINANNRMHAAPPPRRYEIPVSHTFTSATQRRRRQHRSTEHEPNKNSPTFPCGAANTKKDATTKIVGFSPIPVCTARNSIQAAAPQECPSPQARSSFPWSPWILPEQNNAQSEEILSADSSATGFENYLLRGTGNTRSLFDNFHLVSSMRV